MAYWHSENVTGYVEVPKCPACGGNHSVVVLYTDEDHVELPPYEFLNGARLPCGARVDLIYERSAVGVRPYDSGWTPDESKPRLNSLLNELRQKEGT
jgi:hypothetical protein